MPSPGKPLLVKMNGYWHFAHLLRATKDKRVQPSIENYQTVPEACRVHGEEVSVEIGPGKYLPMLASHQLRRLRDGDPLPDKKHLKTLHALGLIAGWKRKMDKDAILSVTPLGVAVLDDALAG